VCVCVRARARAHVYTAISYPIANAIATGEDYKLCLHWPSSYNLSWFSLLSEFVFFFFGILLYVILFMPNKRAFLFDQYVRICYTEQMQNKCKKCGFKITLYIFHCANISLRFCGCILQNVLSNSDKNVENMIEICFKPFYCSFF
jgi:hypothetical protein